MAKLLTSTPLSDTTSPPSLSEQAQPDSDSSSLSLPDESRNVTVNSKYVHEDTPPQVNAGTSQDNLQDLKKELLLAMMMLGSWKTKKETNLSKLLSDVAEFKTQCEEIQRSNNQIEDSITFLYAQYVEMKEKLRSIEMETITSKQCMMKLENLLNESQVVSRSSSIEVRNVPEVKNESVRDLLTIIKKLGATLDIAIHDKDVRDIYRRPGNPEKTKPIIVEFSFVGMKESFLASARRFNRHRQVSEKLNHEHIGMIGNKRPIYVVEHLLLSTSKLYFQARQFSKKNGYKFCWTDKGRILLREDTNSKFIHVKSEQCLFNLLNS
ncbi:unnamed protein product [Chilo suppressalis]|uniref:FP protein C-terminal domain-containing protein n=1 Tax=Chilo suppressalis TaxID=168631 RepID=A0ABN8B950_CHISP|nr:unnamed protein product [Chilo suppressalis]